MRYRITDLKIHLDREAERISLPEIRASLPDRVRKALGGSGRGIAIEDFRIIRESLDARKKPELFLVYSVEFGAPRGVRPGAPKGMKLTAADGETREYEPPVTAANALEARGEAENGSKCETPEGRPRPVIAGMGPCGMFAALVLAQAGLRPIVLERGMPVEQRVKDVERFWKEGVLDPESNAQFGEGGAGTFSDGKLTTGINDARVRYVLRTFAEAGGGGELLFKQKPHIGTDVLREVVVNIREKIIALGGEIRFGTRLEALKYTEDRKLTGIVVRSRECGETVLPADTLILALGHSARDTVRALAREGLEMRQKPFSIGVRIEHPQAMINESQYGTPGDRGLGAASYKLNYRCANGRGVYTFCMCPGGEVVVASSQEGGVVTNGMSYRARDGEFANSGLLTDVRTEDFGSDDPLAGIAFQEKYERLAFLNGGGAYAAPKTTWREFAEGAEGAKAVIGSLPDFAVAAIREAMPHLGGKLKGFDSPDAVMTAVETRSSSPVRIVRDGEMQANIRGVIPAGEGAGYAGGIVSAAVDGIKAAERVITTAAQDMKGQTSDIDKDS